jgi:hypothetical protein
MGWINHSNKQVKRLNRIPIGGKWLKWISCLACLMFLAGCTVSYKFTGASIDYNTVKTISIADITNQAVLVYPPLSQQLTEALKDIYIKQTKLKLVPRDGDLSIEGEIVGYELTPLAAQPDGYAAETKLTVTVALRYQITKPSDDFEDRFVAYRTFSASSMLEDVQDALLSEINKEIAESVFNRTVANW